MKLPILVACVASRSPYNAFNFGVACRGKHARTRFLLFRRLRQPDPPRTGRRRFTGHSFEAGGKGASNPLAKRMFRKHKKDARSGKCVEADNLSQVANEFNLKTEAALKKFLTKHKCSATQVVRNADKKLLASCINCAPVVQALGF